MATEAAARPGAMGIRAAADDVRGRHRGTWLAMLLWSAASLIASFVLAVEAVTLAGDPDAVFSCDINAVISCGTVASSWQASVFGFPNAFLGLVTEPVVITVAVAGLAGIRFPRWFMLTAQAVYTVGLVLAYWLLYQAIFDIGAMCPWCMLITVATTFVFFEMTRINLLEGHLPLPASVRRVLVTAARSHLDRMAVCGWLLAVALLVVSRYGAALFG